MRHSFEKQIRQFSVWGRRGVDLAKWLVINWVKLADTKSDLSGDTDVSGTYYSIGVSLVDTAQEEAGEKRRNY